MNPELKDQKISIFPFMNLEKSQATKILVKVLEKELSARSSLEDLKNIFHKWGIQFSDKDIHVCAQVFNRYSAKIIKVNTIVSSEEDLSIELLEAAIVRKFAQILPKIFSFEDLDRAISQIGLSIEQENIQSLLFYLIKSAPFVEAGKKFVSSIDHHRHNYHSALSRFAG